MILFSRETGTMWSDIYGYDGSTELRVIAKKMRLPLNLLRNPSHPVDEHYVIPAAKHPGMAARGVRQVTPKELLAAQDIKRAQVRQAVSQVRAPNQKANTNDEVWQSNGYVNRRRDRAKNWRQDAA